MSWTDHYRRQGALDAVLEFASREPAGPLPFSEVPDVPELFTSPAEVLLALHYRWTLKLTGRIGVAQAETDRDPSTDPVETVSEAWRAAASENPVLRRILDANDVETAGEYRMLALAAGLAEPHEPPAEIARVGAAFLALVRSAPARHRDPVGLKRKLVTSA